MGHIRSQCRKLTMATIAVVASLTLNLFFPFISNSYADEMPFSSGERLTFRLRWALIPAGEAVMEVLPMTTIKGKPAYHFRLTANSNSFVDMFYKVRDCIDAYADESMNRALQYHKKQHEGDHRKNILVDFDWQKSTARFSDGKKRKEVELLPGTFDPLSAFYFTRTMNFTADDMIICPVTDGKKCVYGSARIIKKEKVTVFCGTFDTYLVEPELKHVGGVFKKSKNAKIKVWITADEKRIPVKIASKVPVGSFVGELVSIESALPLQAKRSLKTNQPVKQIKAFQ